jgi:hypothetical protein
MEQRRWQALPEQHGHERDRPGGLAGMIRAGSIPIAAAGGEAGFVWSLSRGPAVKTFIAFRRSEHGNICDPWRDPQDAATWLAGPG